MPPVRVKAFSVIEGLLALAIVAALVAIALPRYEAAQVRSKVSQAKADLRDLGIACDAYAADNQNTYPFDLDPRGWPWYVTDVLTTPVGYLPSGPSLRDPFRSTGPTTPYARRYRFINFPSNRSPGWPPCYLPADAPFRTRWIGSISEPTFLLALETYGVWKLSSSGPDKITDSRFFTSVVIYDPTNGTMSGGDIIRSQKRAD